MLKKFVSVKLDTDSRWLNTHTKNTEISISNDFKKLLTELIVYNVSIYRKKQLLCVSCSLPQNRWSLSGNKNQVISNYHTTFIPSLILSATDKIARSRPSLVPSSSLSAIQKLRRKATNLLLSERSPDWTWNYWQKSSPEYKKLPYPDDLDDTSCALIALSEYFDADVSEKTEAEALASFIRTLDRQKVRTGGPYKTWIIGRSPAQSRLWEDVDLVVQSNITAVLRRYDFSVKSIERLIDKAIREDHFTSKYYPSEAPVIYFISRGYRGKLIEKFAAQAFKRLQDKRLTYLEQNLLVCALLNCEPFLPEKRLPAVWKKRLEAHFQDLLATPHRRRIRAFPFCIDPRRDGITYYNGSEALTCAIEMEAIHSFLESEHLARQKTLEEAHKKAVESSLDGFTRKQPEPIRSQLAKACNRILDGTNQREVWLLPFWWKGNVSDIQTIHLSCANILGWAAYRIYDDCLDEAAGGARGKTDSVTFLPLANLCSYEAFDLFRNSSKNTPRNSPYIRSIFHRMEQAIAREHCRRSADSLQEKSIAHCLGPILISPDKAAEDIFRCFRHYLTARQLGDDIRDQEEDKKRCFRNLASDRHCTVREYAALEKEMRLHTKKALSIIQELEKRNLVICSRELEEMIRRPENELTKMLREHRLETCLEAALQTSLRT